MAAGMFERAHFKNSAPSVAPIGCLNSFGISPLNVPNRSLTVPHGRGSVTAVLILRESQSRDREGAGGRGRTSRNRLSAPKDSADTPNSVAPAKIEDFTLHVGRIHTGARNQIGRASCRERV